MPTMTPALCSALWQRALAEEIGIRIKVLPADKVVIENTLYEVRRTSGDPSLQALIMCRPGPHPDEIWILKKATEL